MEISPTEMQSTGDFRENLDRLRYIRSFLRFFVHETIIIVGDEKKKLSLSFERKIFKQNFLLIITLYPRESNMLIARLSNAYLIFKNDRGGGR